MIPIQKYSSQWHDKGGQTTAGTKNFVRGQNVYVVDVDDYDRERSMLYALGAQSVANKMMANVDLIVYGGSTIPAKARAKYPTGQFERAEWVLPLFHKEVPSFADYIRAFEQNGFTVRNPSDEGDARFDFVTMAPPATSLPETLLDYLRTSPFIRQFATKQYFPIDKREDGYIDFPIPGTDLTWYYTWHASPWNRVSAQRGEGDYPLQIKGDQLMRVTPVFWTESTGLYFHEYPHLDSINGLFVVAGIDARSGNVHIASISRVWT